MIDTLEQRKIRRKPEKVRRCGSMILPPGSLDVVDFVSVRAQAFHYENRESLHIRARSDRIREFQNLSDDLLTSPVLGFV